MSQENRDQKNNDQDNHDREGHNQKNDDQESHGQESHDQRNQEQDIRDNAPASTKPQGTYVPSKRRRNHKQLLKKKRGGGRYQLGHPDLMDSRLVGANLWETSPLCIAVFRPSGETPLEPVTGRQFAPGVPRLFDEAVISCDKYAQAFEAGQLPPVDPQATASSDQLIPTSSAHGVSNSQVASNLSSNGPGVAHNQDVINIQPLRSSLPEHDPSRVRTRGRRASSMRHSGSRRQQPYNDGHQQRARPGRHSYPSDPSSVLRGPSHNSPSQAPHRARHLSDPMGWAGILSEQPGEGPPEATGFSIGGQERRDTGQEGHPSVRFPCRPGRSTGSSSQGSQGGYHLRNPTSTNGVFLQAAQPAQPQVDFQTPGAMGSYNYTQTATISSLYSQSQGLASGYYQGDFNSSFAPATTNQEQSVSLLFFTDDIVNPPAFVQGSSRGAVFPHNFGTSGSSSSAAQSQSSAYISSVAYPQAASRPAFVQGSSSGTIFPGDFGTSTSSSLTITGQSLSSSPAHFSRDTGAQSHSALMYAPHSALMGGTPFSSTTDSLSPRDGFGTADMALQGSLTTPSPLQGFDHLSNYSVPSASLFPVPEEDAQDNMQLPGSDYSSFNPDTNGYDPYWQGPPFQ